MSSSSHSNVNLDSGMVAVSFLRHAKQRSKLSVWLLKAQSDSVGRNRSMCWLHSESPSPVHCPSWTAAAARVCGRFHRDSKPHSPVMFNARTCIHPGEVRGHILNPSRPGHSASGTVTLSFYFVLLPAAFTTHASMIIFKSLAMAAAFSICSEFGIGRRTCHSPSPLSWIQLENNLVNS